MININTIKNHKILKKCKTLREYSLFIDAVRAHEKEKDGMKKAIEECIKNSILAEYLKRKGSEVRNMLVAEYSYEEDIQVKQEEARIEGIEQGVKQGIEQMVVNALTTTKNVGQTALILHLDENDIRKIAEDRNIPIND